MKNIFQKSSWSTDCVEIIALIMTMKNKPQAVMMSFQKEYAEPYEWLVEVFRDWAAHKHTAAEVIYQRADAQQEINGLQ